MKTTPSKLALLFQKPMIQLQARRRGSKTQLPEL